MSNWIEITERPNDEERQKAYLTGVGGYGGEDTEQPEVRQKTLPNSES